MTDDDMRVLTDTLVAELRPMRDVTERVLTLVENLTRRVEILELQQLLEREADCTPIAPPEG